MTSIQVPVNIKEQVQAFSIALAWEDKQSIEGITAMIDPKEIKKANILDCIKKWKEGQLTWEQSVNATIDPLEMKKTQKDCESGLANESNSDKFSRLQKIIDTRLITDSQIDLSDLKPQRSTPTIVSWENKINE